MSLPQVTVGSTGGGVVFRDLDGERGSGPLSVFRVEMPAISRACYYAPFQKYAINPALDLWPEGYNQCHPLAVESLAGVKRGGMFAVAELVGGGFVCLLPLVSSRLMTWLRGDEDGLLLEADHWGTAGISERDMPLLAWAVADHPYDAATRVWELAAGDPAIAAGLGLRREKQFPKVFETLGWCTWEEFKSDISEASLVKAFGELAAAPVPVRWVLIDDGHLEETSVEERARGPVQDGEVPAGSAERKLVGFGVNQRRFPDGWAPVMQAVREFGFDEVGVWLNFNGFWGGIAAMNRLGPVDEALIEVSPGTKQPKPSPEAAESFYGGLVEAQQRAGFSFVKVDNQAGNIPFYRGAVDNAVWAASCNHLALENAVAADLGGMINCMAHNNVCAFHTKRSAVTRCSEDYKKGDLWRARHHLSNSFGNMLWLRATVWGDHDMFHSSDDVAGAVMARSKAVSGGPIYLSDAPECIRPELVLPLCYNDGRLLRPMEPAVPSPDSLFIDTYQSPEAFRVLAPLTNQAVAVVGYNLTDPEISVAGAVRYGDFGDAMRLAGLPDREGEALLVYRPDDGVAVEVEVDEDVRFTIPRFGDALFWMVEICAGWAVLGRADKFIGPAAVGAVEARVDAVNFTLAESGPVLVWLESGIAEDESGVEAVSLGHGVWRFDFPLGPTREVRLRRARTGACDKSVTDCGVRG